MTIFTDIRFRILIFVLYKREAVELQGKLQAKGYHVTAIHGDKSQVLLSSWLVVLVVVVLVVCLKS